MPGLLRLPRELLQQREEEVADQDGVIPLAAHGHVPAPEEEAALLLLQAQLGDQGVDRACIGQPDRVEPAERGAVQRVDRDGLALHAMRRAEEAAPVG